MIEARCAYVSDVGLVRRNNEDDFALSPEIGFFAIADGMGGHKAGEVASHEAIRFLTYSLEELLLIQEPDWTTSDMEGFMRLLYENTNSWVYELQKQKEAYKGMGTTLTSILFYKGNVFIGNVGDSRAYRIRNGSMSQLTVDHSLANAYRATGQDPAPDHKKNILTMAIGTNLEIIPQIDVVSIMPSDVYLLCSDGLSDYVDDREIEEILLRAVSPEEKVGALIEAAKAHESMDNITVIVVEIGENIP